MRRELVKDANRPRTGAQLQGDRIHEPETLALVDYYSARADGADPAHVAALWDVLQDAIRDRPARRAADSAAALKKQNDDFWAKRRANEQR